MPLADAAKVSFVCRPSPNRSAVLTPNLFCNTQNLSHVVSPIRIPNDVSSSTVNSPLVVLDEDPFSQGQVLSIPDTARIRAACPPSPSTPMPKPPLRVSLNSGPRSAPIRSSMSAFPQSPTPTKSPATALFSRQFRRRPVLIDDSTSLSRLSTLFETSNVAEVDFLANSPVVAESIDAYSRVARASVDKVKQITGDDDAQALYSARVAHNALPWFLKPEHSDSDIKVEYDGTVTAGTLSALVERLTVEHYSKLFNCSCARTNVDGTTQLKHRKSCTDIFSCPRTRLFARQTSCSACFLTDIIWSLRVVLFLNKRSCGSRKNCIPVRRGCSPCFHYGLSSTGLWITSHQ